MVLFIVGGLKISNGVKWGYRNEVLKGYSWG